MIRQTEIMNEIAHLALESAQGEYDGLGLEVELHVEEGWAKLTFWQTIDGVSESLPLLLREDDPSLLDLNSELHKEMDASNYRLFMRRDGEPG